MCLKMVVQTATREFPLPDITGQKSARTSRPWETKTDQSMVQPVQHGQHGNALLCGSYGLQLVQLVQLVWLVLGQAGHCELHKPKMQCFNFHFEAKQFEAETNICWRWLWYETVLFDVV